MSLRKLLVKGIVTEDFFSKTSIKSFNLTPETLNNSELKRLSCELKPACIDYRSSSRTQKIDAVAYVLADECNKRNNIYLNKLNWQKFCAEYNLPEMSRPDHEQLIRVVFWESKLTNLVERAQILHKHYATENSIDIIHEDIYQKLLRKRKRKFRTIDNVLYDQAYTKRRSDVAYYLTELKGINELAFAQTEIKLFHVTIRLPDKYHRTSASTYEFIDPAVAAKQLHDLLDSNFKNKLTRHADNDDVQTYYARATEPHQDGTPHIHLLFWYHDEAYLRQLIDQQYIAKFGALSTDSIIITDHTNKPEVAIKYLIKNLWGKPFRLTREEAWRQAHKIRAYSSGSFNSNLPKRVLWNQARQGKLSTEVNSKMITVAQNKNYAAFCHQYGRLNDSIYRDNTLAFKLENLYFSVKKNVKSFFTYIRQL